MTDENTTTEPLDNDGQIDSLLKEYGIVFFRLLESQRFKDLMSVYFTFQKVVNDETKEIDFQIIENPPEIVAQKVQAQGQGKKPTVELVSGSAAKAILEQAEKKAKQRFTRR